MAVEEDEFEEQINGSSSTMRWSEVQEKPKRSTIQESLPNAYILSLSKHTGSVGVITIIQMLASPADGILALPARISPRQLPSKVQFIPLRTLSRLALPLVPATNQ